MTVHEIDRRSHKFALDTDITSVCLQFAQCGSQLSFVTFCGINTIKTAVTVRSPSSSNETPTANGPTSHRPFAVCTWLVSLLVNYSHIFCAFVVTQWFCPVCIKHHLVPVCLTSNIYIRITLDMFYILFIVIMDSWNVSKISISLTGASWMTPWKQIVEWERKPTRCNRCSFLTISQHVSGIIMPIFRRTRRMLLHVVCCAVTGGES